jgi:hypothetical protein
MSLQLRPIADSFAHEVRGLDLLYVADRYAAGRLAPTLDAPQRGRFRYWMS